MPRHARSTPLPLGLFALVVSGVLLVGCYESHLRPGPEGDGGRPGWVSDGSPRPSDGAVFVEDGGLWRPPRPTRDVDILLVIDDSERMQEERASLAAELPRLLAILTTGDFDQDGSLDSPDDFAAAVSIHLGVVSTDMGTGGYPVSMCRDLDRGLDGRFQPCGDTTPEFLDWAAGERTEDLADVARCHAAVGPSGCELAQPLEAALKALSPTGRTLSTARDYTAPEFFFGAGHGNGAHDGFLRPGSVLAVVPITDQDDCSLLDRDLLAEGTRAPHVRCVRREDGLQPETRYIDGLLQLRHDSERLVVAPIVGVPVDLVASGGSPTDWPRLLSDDPDIRDPRMQQLDPSGAGLTPSCNVPGRGVAYPPLRLLRTARELEVRGAGVTVQSICQESFTGALVEIIRQIQKP